MCKYPEVLRKASRGSSETVGIASERRRDSSFPDILLFIPYWLRALENLTEAKNSIKIEENGEYVLARNYDYAL